MDSTPSQPAPKRQPGQIDLYEVGKKLWRNRRFLVRWSAAFFIVAVLIALFSPKIYVASCTLVPQSTDKRSSSSLTGLAALAGINMNSYIPQSNLLSPLVYPNIVGSTAFQRELMYTPLSFNGYDEPIRLIDYLTDKRYRRFSLGSTIKRYTLGLPALIIHAVQGTSRSEADSLALPQSTIIRLSGRERKCLKAMSGMVSVALNDKDGYVTLWGKMNEPLAAAQLAEKALTMLQRYITSFKVEKVQSNLDFIEGRYNEVKNNYEAVQMRRAAFKDANQQISTSRSRTELEKLDNEYNLAFSLYSELARQLEQAKIQVKETTPILTVIDPVTVPIDKAAPRRPVIVVGITVIGVVLGCLLVLLVLVLRSLTGRSYLHRWLRD